MEETGLLKLDPTAAGKDAAEGRPSKDSKATGKKRKLPDGSSVEDMLASGGAQASRLTRKNLFCSQSAVLRAHNTSFSWILLIEIPEPEAPVTNGIEPGNPHYTSNYSKSRGRRMWS